MTITTRLTLFLLAALGAVLAGFSAALLLLAREYLHRQTADRLEAAANTLVAACEVGPEGVEWEPRERSLAFAVGPAGDRIAWLVTNDAGRMIGKSDAPAADDLLAEAAARLAERQRPTARVSWRGERWQVRQQWLIAPPADGPAPKPAAGETRYPAVAVTVGVPVGPVRAALARLGTALAGLSVTVWLLAAVVGRAVCRRALRPLTRMAEAARGMSADDPGVRLPVGPAADEPGELGRAFNGLLDRLGEAHERQRRFTAEASHQLRTPLAAMLGQVEVALRRDRPADEYRQALEAVRSQAGRLRQVTDALLFLARSDADASPPAREPVDLGAWLRTHLTAWADHPRAADLKLIPEAEGPVTVAVHPVMLGELVNNLIDNALKYSPPGTPVTVRFGNSGVSVEDLGYGIDPADRADLFRPFYRSTAARRLGVPGLGLGLAITGRLAAALGATVDVSSEVGKGSRFTVRLPDSL